MEDLTKKYKLKYDHHTHTNYTHGKGTILDNVRVAHEKGIPEIAITEHGPGNVLYGFKWKDMDRMQEDIKKAKKLYPDVNVLFGIELNIVRHEPYIDIDPNLLKNFDIVLCGFHYSCINGGTIPNYLWKITHRDGLHYELIDNMYQPDMSMLMVKNTTVLTNAILNNKIDIVTHVGDKGPFDVVSTCEACEKTGTLLEINLKHKHLNKEELLIAKDYDVNFVISSDAHRPSDVGVFEPQLKLALECGIDVNRIVNIEEIK